MRHVLGQQGQVARGDLEFEVDGDVAVGVGHGGVESQAVRVDGVGERRVEFPRGAVVDDGDPGTTVELGADRRGQRVGARDAHAGDLRDLDPLHGLCRTRCPRGQGDGENRHGRREGRPRAGHPPRPAWCVGLHGNAQPVAAAGHRAHDACVGRGLAERAADLGHAEVHAPFEVDDPIRPEVRLDLLARDQPARAVDEQFEQPHRLRRQGDALVAPQERPRHTVETERAETLDLSCFQRLVSFLGVLWDDSGSVWVVRVRRRRVDRDTAARARAASKAASKGSPVISIRSCLVLLLLAATADAMVVRHDRDPDDFVAAAARFDAVVEVGPGLGDGTLIAPTWVLTAAHVARALGADGGVAVDGRPHAVDAVFVHPDFRPMGPHDLALLRLAAPVADVQPLALYDGPEPTGRTAWLVGHGQHGVGNDPARTEDGQRRAVTNVIERTDSDHLVFRFDAPPAGTEYEGTPAPGDSGGPALLEIDGAFVVAGVSSLGEPGADGPGSYGAHDFFGRVTMHRGWIDDVLGGRVAPEGPFDPAQIDGPAGRAFVALFDFLQTAPDDARRTAFVEGNFAPALIERRSVADLVGILAQLEGDLAGARIDGILDDGRLRFEAGVESDGQLWAFGVQVEEDAPHRVLGLMLGPMAGDGPEVAWDTLAEDFEAAVEEGFCGSVIAIRDGEVVLERGFGWADPAREHPVTPNTLFAIGSTPIDFTHVGILLLEQEGKLSRSDRLTKFFDGVPADKQAITLEHLRTGQSGMIDFPNLPGVDANPDLSWIDRAEFLRRAWASELLFEPGTDRQHSHFAWGILAAVIEVVSGQDYETFVRERIFDVVGLERTGHFPLAKEFPMREVAVGLGGRVWGEVNAPPYWGPTSWLVLGSGGMVSTPGELARFYQWVASGDVLGPAGQEAFGIHGALLNEGGNDRGFVNTIGLYGRNIVIVCSNSQTEPGDFTARFAMSVAALAERE